MRIILICIMCIFLVGYDTQQSSQQIVEKGEYTRLQYVIENGVMSPEFVKRYYVVVRNGNTGAEKRVTVSENEYKKCVVGDMVNKIRK